MDCFTIFDYKQTTLYHGLNREPEFYDTQHNLRKPLHKRKRMWPTVEEFWKSEEVKPFRLICDDYAEHRKFKRWFKLELAAREKLGGNLESEVLEKYGPEIDISHGEFDVKGVINTEMAIFNYDNSYHMTAAELKAAKEKPEKIVPPKMFDISKATRVYVDKEEIKRRQELAEQERLRE